MFIRSPLFLQPPPPTPRSRVANRGLTVARVGRKATGVLLVLAGIRLGKQMAELCSAAVQAGITDAVSPVAQAIDGLVSG